MELKNNYLEVENGDYIWFVINNHALPYEFDETITLNFEDFLNNFINGGYNKFLVYESISNIGAIGLMASVDEGEIKHIYSK